MNFFLSLTGFVIIVGSGSLWLLIKTRERKKLLKCLLSMPKERRFFWYKLRKNGYKVEKINIMGEARILVDNEDVSYKLKLDFLLRKNRKKYGGIFTPPNPEKKELLKVYFIYASVFGVDGILFYDESKRDFSVFEEIR